MNRFLPRRTVLGAGMAAAGAAALGGRAFAQAAKPKSPLAINIVDVAGNLALTQKAFENYRQAKPDMVSRMTFTKATAPELPSKLLAEQQAQRLDIDLVLTGTDALAAGIEQKIWATMVPAHNADLPDLQKILLPGAEKMQGLAQGRGVIVSYCPGGPLLEYMPDQVKTPPGSADELLAFTKAKPGRFMYARPANSGPGRAFLMGLPYILGDSNPKDPVKGWDKTWAYLKELGNGIEYYPTGTAAVMKELGDGTIDMIATMTGWDINPRALGIVPKEAKIATMKGFHFIADAHYMCVPAGLDAERMGVLLDLMSYMLQPPQQAITYDEGYFYPGPAVQGVTLSMAPKASQEVIATFGRPEYEKMLADTPIDLPLDAGPMVQAFRIWDEQIGTKKTK